MATPLHLPQTYSTSSQAGGDGAAAPPSKTHKHTQILSPQSLCFFNRPQTAATRGCREVLEAPSLQHASSAARIHRVHTQRSRTHCRRARPIRGRGSNTHSPLTIIHKHYCPVPSPFAAEKTTTPAGMQSRCQQFHFPDTPVSHIISSLPFRHPPNFALCFWLLPHCQLKRSSF